MIRSMTGFASLERHYPFGRLAWELRSLNHRYLEFSLRCNLHPALVALKTGIHTLEVKTVRDDPARLVDRIGQLVYVHLGHHIERRHCDNLRRARNRHSLMTGSRFTTSGDCVGDAR